MEWWLSPGSAPPGAALQVQKHQEQRAETPATRLEIGVEAQLIVG